jgi:hypothetical protein
MKLKWVTSPKHRRKAMSQIEHLLRVFLADLSSEFARGFDDCEKQVMLLQNQCELWRRDQQAMTRRIEALERSQKNCPDSDDDS